jgi:hypothetical protein
MHPHGLEGQGVENPVSEKRVSRRLTKRLDIGAHC